MIKMRYLLIANIAFMLPALALSSEALKPKKVAWPFEGIFGTFDKKSAQRGFQVYREVCSSCHSLKRVYYRNLEQIGFSIDEIKQIAKEYTVRDGPNDEGEMFDRPALPSDRFISPYKNDAMARYSNNGALPVDLSLIIKARHDGANYVYSLLTGYQELEPKNLTLMPGLNYNPYFPGMQIAMPKPLFERGVVYQDGTQPSVEQMARDVVIFLQWASEPEMEHRKSIGLKVVLFLTFFIMVFYLAKRKIWQDIK